MEEQELFSLHFYDIFTWEKQNCVEFCRIWTENEDDALQMAFGFATMKGCDNLQVTNDEKIIIFLSNDFREHPLINQVQKI